MDSESGTSVMSAGKDEEPARSPLVCPRRNQGRDRPNRKGAHRTVMLKGILTESRRANPSTPRKLFSARRRDVAGALGGSAGKPGSTARRRSRAKRGASPDGDAVGPPGRSPNASTEHSNHSSARRIEWS